MNQNTQKTPFNLSKMQCVFLLIHIVRIYSCLKLDKYYIDCPTNNSQTSNNLSYVN
jgi:hypothetical protein